MKFYNDLMAYARKKLGFDATASDAEIHQAALDELAPKATNTPQNTTEMTDLDTIKSLLEAQKTASDKQLSAILMSIAEQNAAIATLQGEVKEIAQTPNASVSDTPKSVVSAQRDANMPSWAKNPANKHIVDKCNQNGVDLWEYTRDCIRQQAEA